MQLLLSLPSDQCTAYLLEVASAAQESCRASSAAIARSMRPQHSMMNATTVPQSDFVSLKALMDDDSFSVGNRKAWHIRLQQRYRASVERQGRSGHQTTTPLFEAQSHIFI
eukprot:1194-Heterococcus_DN1.PRE.2